MNIKYLPFVFVLFLFAGCEKTETIKQTDLTGAFAGYITVRDEFGNFLDKDGVLIQIEGTDPLLTGYTDTAGYYYIPDVPSGTYNIIISKEGFTEMQYQGIQLVGGGYDYYYSAVIYETPTTEISNLNVEITEDSKILLTGYVDYDSSQGETPKLACLIDTTADISLDNYLYVTRFSTESDELPDFSEELSLNTSYFPSGTTAYIAVCAAPYDLTTYYVTTLGGPVSTGYGTPSNVVSIVVP